MITGDLNSLIVILIYGSLILLSFLKLANPLKVNKKANYWFGIFLLLWSTFWIEEITFMISGNDLNIYFAVFIHFVQFFAPIVLFFSVVFYTNPNYKLQKADVKYLILPIIFLIFLLLQQTYSKEDSITFQLILTGLILVQALFYIIVSYLRIRKHQKKILLFSSDTNGIDLNWLEYIIFLILSTSIIVSIYNVVLNSIPPNVYINITFLFVIYSIAYYSLKQKEIFPLDEKQRNEVISINEDEQFTELKRKIITDEELITLKSRLGQLMQQQKPYLDSELNLIKLSELLNITSHQLSYVINTGFNENFFQFINKHRVEKAKELLIKDGMNNLSILGIAFESGFNSKTSFNTTFKKITNQTPSEFKKRVLLYNTELHK